LGAFPVSIILVDAHTHCWEAVAFSCNCQQAQGVAHLEKSD